MPLKPFAAGTWAIVFTTLVLGGFCSAFLSAALKDFSISNLKDHVLAHVLGSFDGGADDKDPDVDHASRRIVATGSNFFLFVTLTLYTANLAVILADNEDYRLDIDSIDDCSRQACRICIHNQVWNAFTPRLQHTKVRMVNAGNTPGSQMDLLESGACDCALLSENDYEILDESAAYGESLVKYQYVGRSELSYSNAYGVRRAFASAVSQLIRQIIEENLYEGYWRSHAGDLNTDPWVDTDDDYDETKPITPVQMFGPAAITFLLFVFSLFYHQRHAAEHQAKKLRVAVQRSALTRSVSKLTGLGSSRETLPECPDARDVRAVDGAGAERDAAADAPPPPPPPSPPPTPTTDDADAMPTRPTRRATNEGSGLPSFFCYGENDHVSQTPPIRLSP